MESERALSETKENLESVNKVYVRGCHDRDNA